MIENPRWLAEVCTVTEMLLIGSILFIDVSEVLGHGAVVDA